MDIKLRLPDGVGSQHQLVIMNPDNWRCVRHFSFLVQLLVQLPQGVHGGVGEQLVHLCVGLYKTRTPQLMDGRFYVLPYNYKQHKMTVIFTTKPGCLH